MASTGEKEQYGENQYGAWMNVMKGRGSKWVYVAAANRIGLEQYYLIQQELNFGELPHSWTTRRNFGASLTRQRDFMRRS
jgi:hypothetical protein